MAHNKYLDGVLRPAGPGGEAADQEWAAPAQQVVAAHPSPGPGRPLLPVEEGGSDGQPGGGRQGGVVEQHSGSPAQRGHTPHTLGEEEGDGEEDGGEPQVGQGVSQSRRHLEVRVEAGPGENTAGQGGAGEQGGGQHGGVDLQHLL